MRVLVTGAGGFVGSHTAKGLAQQGCDVLALVHRNRPATLNGVPGVEILQGDLAGFEPLPVAGPCQAIVHCAAAIPPTVPDEAELFRQNVEGMRSVLAFGRASGTRTVINCSSMSAFGRIEVDVVSPEVAPIEPGSYGRSKLEGERMLAAFAEETGARTLSLRLPGVGGNGSHDNFLSTIVAAIAAKQPVAARNPRSLFNNIVHIDDLVEFFAVLCETLEPGHRVATIAADEPMPITAVITNLCDAGGYTGEITFERGGHSFLICTESARALGYCVPTVEDSVRRLARDCLSRD
jgi:nucleoside-diphosphate-sugar epimerase